MYESLPKNERSFDIDLVGETTMAKYKGQFTVTCILDIAGRHEQELEKTRLMADYANPSKGLYGIATALAALRTKIISSPDWWKNTQEGAKIQDEEVIFFLYEKCNEMERLWRSDLKQASKQAEKENQAKPEEPATEKT